MFIDDVIEKLDNVFYRIHRIPAKTVYHTLNWSKYTSAKVTSAVGFLSLAVYNATVFGPIVKNEGLEALVYNSFDSPERLLTRLSAIAIDIVYPLLFIKNWRRAKVAEEREIELNKQLLSEVLPHEEKLERYNFAPTAFWYMTTETVWPTFSAWAGNLDNPVGIGYLAAIMIATSCLYGPRYVLHTEFYSNKGKEITPSTPQQNYKGNSTKIGSLQYDKGDIK